ncbi:MAG: hypothetical protein NTU85_01590 [Candidatus Kaiserbacteria bacterium]|nr:hypothetical protein [Candidatus Kaiserbacteria bacterium]
MKSLDDPFHGPLKVSIIVGGETYTESRNFREKIVDEITTLFDYVGSVAAATFTNMTTRLSVRMDSDEWKIIEFSPERQILIAEKISGEQWEIKEDDESRLTPFLDCIGDREGRRCPCYPCWN